MSWRLLLLFTGVPILELYILIQVGSVIGAGPTVLLVLFTGIIGAYLARREGLAVLNEIRSKLQAGRAPAGELLDGAVILISGALLLTPGLLTDILGFSGLIPASRRILKTRGWEFVRARWLKGIDQSSPSRDEDIDPEDYEL